MTDVKVSGLPNYSTPISTDTVPIDDVTNTLTKKATMAVLAAYFFSGPNIPAGSGSPITRDNESQAAFVASGMIWSGDAYASTLNASMTSGIVYINGRRISIGSVTGRAFTASKDTYVDVLDNLDGTGTLVYTTVTNNAASPALAANSIRIGIIVTGGNIAAAGSVNQGQESRVLPIASSIPYAVTESLGNLICSRDPANRLIGYRQILTSPTFTTPTSETEVTGLKCVVNVPSGRKVKVTADPGSGLGSSNGTVATFGACITSASSGNVITYGSMPAGANGMPFSKPVIYTPPAGANTFLAFVKAASGNVQVIGAATSPAFIMVELD